MALLAGRPVFSEAGSHKGCGGKKNKIAHASWNSSDFRDNWLCPSEMSSLKPFQPHIYLSTLFIHFMSCFYEAPGTRKARSIPRRKVWDYCKCVSWREKHKEIPRELTLERRVTGRWGHPRREATLSQKRGNKLWWCATRRGTLERGRMRSEFGPGLGSLNQWSWQELQMLLAVIRTLLQPCDIPLWDWILACRCHGAT